MGCPVKNRRFFKKKLNTILFKLKMNSNKLYYISICSITFCRFFPVKSLCYAHRTSGLSRQKTDPSAILESRYCPTFYHLRSSANTETNGTLTVQGQGYMVDAKFPTKLTQFLASDQRCMRSSVVRMKYDWSILVASRWRPYNLSKCWQ